MINFDARCLHIRMDEHIYYSIYYSSPKCMPTSVNRVENKLSLNEVHQDIYDLETYFRLWQDVLVIINRRLLQMSLSKYSKLN